MTAEANQLRAKWALVVDSGAVPAAEADLFAIDGPGGKGKGKRKGRKKKKGGASASAAEGEQGGDDGGMPPIGSNQKEGGNDASMPWSDKQTRDIQIG